MMNSNLEQPSSRSGWDWRTSIALRVVIAVVSSPLWLPVFLAFLGVVGVLDFVKVDGVFHHVDFRVVPAILFVITSSVLYALWRHRSSHRKSRKTASTHPEPKGLFAHIQANNLRSIALFAWFGVLLMLLQLAVLVFYVSRGMPMERMLESMARSSGAVINPMDLTSEQKAKRKRLEELADRVISDDISISAMRKIVKDENLTDMQEAFALPHRSNSRSAKRRKIVTTATKPQFTERRQYRPLDIVATRLIKDFRILEGTLFYIYIPFGIYILIGLWFHSSLVRRQTGARRVSRQQEARLHGILEPLAVARGLPMPKVEVIETPAMNAYATGLSPNDASIGVTRGLLTQLSDRELEAVLAHEIAHVENRDNRLMTVANLCAGVVTPLGRKIRNMVARHPIIGSLFIAWTLIILPWQSAAVFYGLVFSVLVLATSVKHMISRKREFIADARAIEIVKDPAALVRALHKIAQNDRIEGLNPTVQTMMISNLSGAGQATHPEIHDRIAAICATTGISFEAALAEKSNWNRSVWAGAHPGVQHTDTSHVAPKGVQGLRAQMFGQATSPDVDEWSPEEIRSEQLVQEVEHVRARASKALRYGVLGMFMSAWLPLLLIPLFLFYAIANALGWISLPILGYLGYRLWKRIDRRSRMNNVLAAGGPVHV